MLTLESLKKQTKTVAFSTMPGSAPCLSWRRPSCQHPACSTLPQTAREGPAGSIQLSASGYSCSSRIRIQVERRWLHISVNSTCSFLLIEMVLKTWRQRRAPRQAASQALNSCQHSHTSLLPSTGVAAAILPAARSAGENEGRLSRRRRERDLGVEVSAATPVEGRGGVWL